MLGASIGAGGMWAWAHLPTTYVGVAQVVDGDNLRVEGHNIRLVGINSPELPDGPPKCREYLSRPECTEPTALALDRFLNGRQVVCLDVGRDMYFRPLGICYVDTIEINQWLLEQCLAGSPHNPKHRLPRYEKLIAERKCKPA